MFSAAARPCQPAASKAALNGAPHGVWLKLPQAWMRALLSWAARVRVRWACRAGRPAWRRVADTRHCMARTWAALGVVELSPAQVPAGASSWAGAAWAAAGSAALSAAVVRAAVRSLRIHPAHRRSGAVPSRRAACRRAGRDAVPSARRRPARVAANARPTFRSIRRQPNPLRRPRPPRDPRSVRDVLRTPGALSLFAASCVARLPMGALGLLLVLHTEQLTGSYAHGGLAAGAYALALGISNPALARVVDRRGQTAVLRAPPGWSSWRCSPP